ncbi:hypothetical protein IOCL2690_000010700, partial [Leishmania lindenbergi]
RALLQPFITRSLDVALRAAFDYQSITLDIRYDSVRVLVYYFYSSYSILFRPLAAPERHNIFRRLVTAFGVPQQGILEHLAARGAMQWLSQVRKINGFMYQRGPLECNSPTTRTRALLQPFITRSLDVALRAAFDYQSITLDIRYDSVRVLVYYFYSSYSILFRPLAAPERHNIFRRLVTAFGVPQQGILEHLAARGAMQWLSQVRKINGFMYQRGPLECNSPTTRTPATTSPCSTPPEAKPMHR